MIIMIISFHKHNLGYFPTESHYDVANFEDWSNVTSLTNTSIDNPRFCPNP